MKISRFFIIIAATVCVAFSVVPVSAQGASGGIAVVDMQRIFRDSAASKSIQAQLEKYRVAAQQETTKEENDLRKVEQELVQQRALISPESFAERRRQFEQRVNNLQRDDQNRKREFDKVQASAIRTVETSLRDIIGQLVTEQKLILVLPKSQTIFLAPELEITDEVIKRLNAKLPSVKVSAPAKPAPQAKTPPTAKPPPGK